MKRNEATEAQVRAANPQSSTWLAANAGSGKTRVLTDRVARLLLSEVPPENILCLTYTKAAATEMQNRLFERLGGWSMLGNDALRGALEELGVADDLSEDVLARARSLFARAIETPGGLKIQTIHAFCASILRRFPLEAGVSPRFKEMEDRAGELLRADILRNMADGPEAQVLANLSLFLTDADFATIAGQVVSHRAVFQSPRTRTDLAQHLDIPEGTSPEDIEKRAFMGGEAELIAELIPLLVSSGGNDAKLAAKLSQIQDWSLTDLPLLENAFLFGEKTKAPFCAKIGSVPNKALRNGDAAHLMPQLEAFMLRIEDTRELRLKLASLERAVALHDFAQTFLPLYEAEKAARGWLDFDDLIQKTRDLLAQENAAAWVLFRLDGGIDHILVDEAQDTSPLQWEVVDLLAQEFTSGEGARSNVARTVFVVGDKKQSIYSFQGADPSGFDRMRGRFKDKLQRVGAPFQDAALEFSFRSSAAILDLVDVVFEGREAAGFPTGGQHKSFKSDMPGRVDLWPVIPKAEKQEDRVWTDTIDRVDDAHENVQLANSVATQIADLLGGSDGLPAKTRDGWTARPIEPRDILVLVQRRSPLFHEIIRACKEADLPIAGADVLKVGAELAVRDLGALLNWLALPEDDLALATVLKSPLFGWSEQDLFTLAHGRGTAYLWRVLESRRAQHTATWDILSDLRRNADYLRPYDLLERILILHEGRSKLLARLGTEAEDGINALLEQAIAYESSDIPSLTGFITWMETDDLSIKRQPDDASNQIRVMTVHGSKGLEAPIVILPDCAKYDPPDRGKIITFNGVPLLKPAADAKPKIIESAFADATAAKKQERDRLLYVAMTRAESWLIVAAAGDLGKKGEAWHERIRAAMEASGAMPQTFGDKGTGLRLSHATWPEAITQDGPDPKTTSSGLLEPWLKQPAPGEIKPADVLTPTGLGGAKALAGPGGLDEEAAMDYGTLVHDWLEKLSEHPGTAAPSDPNNHSAFHEAKAVLQDPKLAFLFRADSLAEVSLSVDLPKIGARFHGTIDRLIVEEGRVLAVDFKSNRTVPTSEDQVPEGILRQMGAYAEMLAALYPGKQIDTAILWTHSRSFTPLSETSIKAALDRAAIP